MLILGLDTSDGVGVALVRDGEVLARVDGADQRRHAETLAPGIAWVLAEAGADRRDLDTVAVGTGPAPYTGLRVGLVTARTLARTLGIAALGVCSLDALARQAFDAFGPAGPSRVLCATDARRREVYSALYRLEPDGDVVALAGPQVSRPDAVWPGLGLAGPAGSGAGGSAGGRPAVVGRGAELYPQDLPSTPGGPSVVEAATLVRLARLRAEKGAPTDLTPRYLRRPDVSAPAARKRAS